MQRRCLYPYLGGTNPDRANSAALNSAGNIYVGRFTAATDFPTVNAFQGTNADPAGVTPRRSAGKQVVPASCCGAGHAPSTAAAPTS